MARTPRPRLHLALGLLAGLASSVSLAALWHLFGFVSPPTQGAGYQFTEYFTSCIGWSFAVPYALVSLTLGWISQSKWPVALGMILPLPIAFAIEIELDPTSHNLIPFEIILFWFPAFVVAYGGAYCGQLIRARSAR